MQTSTNAKVRNQLLAHATRDSANAKRFTSEALRAKLDAMDPKPDFEFPPYDHQTVGSSWASSTRATFSVRYGVGEICGCD